MSDGLVVHLPFILLHCRYIADEKGSTAEGVAAVEEALHRRNLSGSVSPGPFFGANNLRLAPPVKPKVSLIIPSRNQVELLRACIESIDSITDYPSFEYVVIDNGTDELSALRFLAELDARPDVTVVRDPGPFNYSALNNLGAFYASGEVLAFINNDLEVVDPDWMSHLVAYAMRPEIGIVGARLLYPDRTIQHGGVVFGVSYHLLEHALQALDQSVGGYQNQVLFDQWISAVMGACMFVRKAVFEELGGLDAECFPVVCNDPDLCLKARLAGYQNVYAGSVACIHHEAQSRGRDDTKEKIEFARRASAAFAVRWGASYRDPYYNPNLTLQPSIFRLSFFPRVHRPWHR